MNAFVTFLILTKLKSKFSIKIHKIDMVAIFIITHGHASFLIFTQYKSTVTNIKNT